MISNTTPIKINLSISSVNEAVRYWLSNIVFRDEIHIKEVSFTDKDHFEIKFIREEEE